MSPVGFPPPSRKIVLKPHVDVICGRELFCRWSLCRQREFKSSLTWISWISMHDLLTCYRCTSDAQRRFVNGRVKSRAFNKKRRRIITGELQVKHLEPTKHVSKKRSYIYTYKLLSSSSILILNYHRIPVSLINALSSLPSSSSLSSIISQSLTVYFSTMYSSL